MSGILRLENLNKGTTLKQGDKTVLSYRLSDADGEQLNIAGKTAVARLMHADFTRIGYESEVLTVSADNTVQFSIDSIIPSRLYYLEITVDGQYIFPSRSDEGKLSIDRSSMGAEITIIENAGIDVVVRKAVDLINEDPSLIIDEDKLISEIIATTPVGSIEEYYQEYRDAIKEYADLKPKAVSAVSKSEEALTTSQNALNVANGIDAKATNALNLSKSADTLSKSVQEQFNQVVIDGDSSVEAAQARVDTKGQTNPTLKARLDKEYNEVTAQLAQTEKDGFASSDFLEMPHSFLKIPSALGGNLTTHPSIVDFGEGKSWNGYRYWLAHTPYPGTQNENPSIAASNNNTDWILPAGAPNPIVPAPPAPSYYSDTEMLYIPETNALRIYYRKTLLPAVDGISTEYYYTESSNGSVWSSPVLCLSSASGAHLSPAIIRESPTSWKMWYVENTTKLGYRTSTDGKVWSAETLINQPWSNWAGWHIGVTKDSNGKYHMLASTWKDAGSGDGTQYRPIVYAHSVDGLNWIGIDKPQLIPTGWAGGYLYRPTFVIDDTKGAKDGLPYVKLWFSASDDGTAAGWHVGYTEGFLMSGDVNLSTTSDVVKRKKIGEYFKVFASNVVASFAKISRIRTKRLEITSDYSQPLVEWRDGRLGRSGGNYLRNEYHGSDNPADIRYRHSFTDDTGEIFVVTYSPFASTPTMSFNKKTNISNVNQLQSTEIINREGIRLYSAGSTSDFNRISTNSLGETVFSLTARGLNYQWKFRAGSGTLDAGNNAIENVKLIKFGIPMAISSVPNGSLFEDSDGKLKYKNLAGEVTILTP